MLPSSLPNSAPQLSHQCHPPALSLMPPSALSSIPPSALPPLRYIECSWHHAVWYYCAFFVFSTVPLTAPMVRTVAQRSLTALHSAPFYSSDRWKKKPPPTRTNQTIQAVVTPGPGAPTSKCGAYALSAWCLCTKAVTQKPRPLCEKLKLAGLQDSLPAGWFAFSIHQALLLLPQQDPGCVCFCLLHSPSAYFH